MRYLFFTIIFFYSHASNAQDALFGTEKSEANSGVVFGVNGTFDVPAADMAERFGLSYRLGATVLYKTKSNWIFGPKLDFIFGSLLREDSLLSNLADKNGAIINQNGVRVGVNIWERGYITGLQAGKIFNLSRTNADNGILVMTGAGFIQHKIAIRDRDENITSLANGYIKGYDRLTNGWYVEQYVGYSYFGDNAMVNFHIGLNILAGFTQGRREWLYDVNRPGTDKRTDILFGIRGGWYIPIFKRKSEDIFF